MDTQQPRVAFGLPPQGASGIVPNVTPGLASGLGSGFATAGRGTALPVTWAGSPWSLTGLSFLNFFLSIVTLGIYGFWGRTEVRKRIWSSVRLAGEPLEYTGTGKELFLGFLFVVGVVFVPLMLLGVATQFATGPAKVALTVVQVASFIPFIYLGAVAVYRARRYRLTRTNWRGIRGALANSGWGYGWTSFWTLAFLPAIVVLVALTLRYGIVGPSIVGHMLQNQLAVIVAALALLIAWLWLVPWRATKLYRQITNDMSFGDRPFSFVGSARPLYARFFARWVGVVILAIATGVAMWWAGLFDLFREMAVTQNLPAPRRRQPTGREIAWLIGIFLVASFVYSIITAWYRAAQANILTAATRFEGVPLKLGVAAGGLIWLFVTNYLISTFTLGILKPVAEARAAKYFVERFAFDGPIDLERIAQSRAALGKTGEGLAQAFDVDAF